jgi:hypothetical protein
MTTHYVDPAAGGDNDGTSWINAWTSLQSAADTAVAGDIVYCRGTQVLTAKIDFDTQDGSLASGYIKFIGCNAGGTNDGTRFVLNGNSAAANCIYMNDKDYIWFENFEFKNATGDGQGEYTAAYWNNCQFINCISHNNGGAGFSAVTGRYSFYDRCSAYSNTGTGFEMGVGWTDYSHCSAHLNTVSGWVSYSSATSVYTRIADSFCYKNTSHGIHINGGQIAEIVNCVVHGHSGAGDIGVYVQAGFADLAGVRITGNTTGLSVAANQRAALQIAYFGSNTADISGSYDIIPINGSTAHVELLGAETDNGYTDSANNDYNLDVDEANQYNVAVGVAV